MEIAILCMLGKFVPLDVVNVVSNPNLYLIHFMFRKLLFVIAWKICKYIEKNLTMVVMNVILNCPWIL